MFTREQRTKKIDMLQQEFSKAASIYLTGINKINVGKVTRLRTEFRKSGLKYIVVKNALAKIALKRLGREEIVPFFKGPIGVVISPSDPTAPARIIRDFHRENKDLLDVKVAYIEGKLIDGAQSDKLADIPSREVLLSQLLSCLKAPMTNLAGTLSGILSTFVGTLEAVKDKKEKSQ
jgi:large subunit ribosomal protein L10